MLSFSGTKLKTKLLNGKVDMKIANYNESSKHLHELLNVVTKDKLLNKSNLKSYNKMNFESVERIT